MWSANHRETRSGSHRPRRGRKCFASIAALALLVPATAWAQEGVERVEQVETVEPEVTTPDVIIVPAPLEAVPPPPVIVAQPPVVVAPPPIVIAPPVVATPQVVVPTVITGGTTEVVIRAREGESPLPISVLHMGPGGDDDGYDPLCTTPCTVQLPPGQYELLAGDHREFTVTANGGRQDWEVEDDGLGGIIAGATLAFSGPLGLALPGMALLTLDWNDHNDEHLGLGYGLIGVGAALGVLGMLLWIESTGAADLVSSTSGAPALGLNLGGAVLVPSFGVAPGEHGDVAWNLGFALSL